MHLNQRIEAFVKLGDFMGYFTDNSREQSPLTSLTSEDYHHFSDLITNAKHKNGWFTPAQIKIALRGWAANLTSDKLTNWLAAYPALHQDKKARNVAVIMAGNLPLVGFHDFLSVLIAGHEITVKPSGKDDQLLPYLTKILIKIEPEFTGAIRFTSEKLSAFDAVIATGSNNTARYFEYYFKAKPHIVRKNRNAVAVLTGAETQAQLSGLADDVFTFFGMGCRSVSKLFVPKGFDFDPFFNAVYRFRECINHAKYANNYDYNKAVYLMGQIPLLDNGFMVLKEDPGFSSPIAVVFYEYYDNRDSLVHHIEANESQIQCVVADSSIKGSVPFGCAQQPNLGDYADGVDTLHFLSDL